MVNEVIIPLGKKDFWNSQRPTHDKQFATYVAHSELAGLFPATSGPAPFAHLAALVKSGAARADLEAILLTGIPAGIVPGFTNFTGSTQADMVRLNTTIPPTKPGTSSTYSTLGVIGGDLADFPNFRRVQDDVVTIELRAIAGATYPLVNKKYVPDAVVADLTDGLTGSSVTNKPLVLYMGIPYDGYHHPPS